LKDFLALAGGCADLDKHFTEVGAGSIAIQQVRALWQFAPFASPSRFGQKIEKLKLQRSKTG
jgi:hypothetical protein